VQNEMVTVDLIKLIFASEIGLVDCTMERGGPGGHSNPGHSPARPALPNSLSGGLPLSFRLTGKPTVPTLRVGPGVRPLAARGLAPSLALSAAALALAAGRAPCK
jgi:hypothetical protein